MGNAIANVAIEGASQVKTATALIVPLAVFVGGLLIGAALAIFGPISPAHVAHNMRDISGQDWALIGIAFGVLSVLVGVLSALFIAKASK